MNPASPRYREVVDFILAPDNPDEVEPVFGYGYRTCYQCPGQPNRLVLSTFTSQPRFDPTTAYRLICGHSAID